MCVLRNCFRMTPAQNPKQLRFGALREVLKLREPWGSLGQALGQHREALGKPCEALGKPWVGVAEAFGKPWASLGDASGSLPDTRRESVVFDLGFARPGRKPHLQHGFRRRGLFSASPAQIDSTGLSETTLDQCLRKNRIFGPKTAVSKRNAVSGSDAAV